MKKSYRLHANNKEMKFITGCNILILILFSLSPPTYSDTYTYDSLNRLVQILHTDGTQTSYTYDSAGNRLSETVTLAPPTIVSNLHNITGVAGDSTTIHIGATGSRPLRYEWSFDGAKIDNQDGQAVNLPHLTLEQAGAYSVKISNDAGNAMSATAVLTVLIPFDYWVTLYFDPEELDNPELVGDGAIPMDDGVPNLLKFFHNIPMDGAMSVTDRAALPKVGAQSENGRQYLTLTYRKNALATGVTFEIEASTDLTSNTWDTISPDTEEEIDQDPVTDDPIIRVKIDVTDAHTKFIRFKAERAQQ